MKSLFVTFLSALVFVGVMTVHVSTLINQLMVDGETNSPIIEIRQSSTSSAQKTNDRTAPSRALIIATVPRSIKHVVGLWTELECFTLDVDRVVLSGPTWSKPILNAVAKMAQERIPRFSATKSKNPISLQVLTFVNNRYDVGLWCDAMDFLQNTGDGTLSSYDEVGLLNDSVFALKEYTGIFSALRAKDVRMTSLNYSLYGPSLKGYGMEHKWLESVWRGFDREGLQTFRDYSCRPANDKLFCPKKKGWKRKKCIIDNFERAAGRQFPPDKTWGLFSSDTPTRILTGKNWFRTWVQNEAYWLELVKDGFPASKISYDKMIDSVNDERLKTCTSRMDRQAFDKFDFSIVPK
ncbi:MAG: hypothetical protein SGILL_007792 [Bacillariaceae sp.]